MKKYVCCFKIILILLLSLVLSGCNSSTKGETVYDIGTFYVESLKIDGEPAELTSVYPEGVQMQLSSDGTAFLTVGSESCKATWLEADTSLRLSFGSMTAEGEKTADGGYRLTVADTGMEFTFKKAEEGLTFTLEDDQTSDNSRYGAQDPVAGSWNGRLWFEDPEGEWSDYEYRSTELTGSVTVLEETANSSSAYSSAAVTSIPENRTQDSSPYDNNPDAYTGNSKYYRINLYSQYFSEETPLLTADFVKENGGYHCLSGFVMSYPISDWGMEITLTSEPADNLRNTVIIEKPGDYGHVFTPETKDTGSTADSEITNSTDTTWNSSDGPVNVLRLIGNCRDANGAFQYVIELIKGSD